MDLEELASRAQNAASLWRRVGSEMTPDPERPGQVDPSSGGVLEQIAFGVWNDSLSEPRQRADAAAVIDAAAEYAAQLRRTLSVIARRDDAGPSNPALDVVASAAATRLPLNRKERYYTGTVLPMIAFSDGFAHTGRLLEMAGLRDVSIAGLEGYADVQMFTEYSFAESVLLPADRDRFADRPPAADTPDLVLAGPDWLLAIEAKLFDQPSVADLRSQLERQRALVDYWTRVLGYDRSRVAHAALLPKSLHDRIGAAADTRVLLWEDVLEEYRFIAPAHWIAVLETALVSELYGSVAYGFGANKEAELTGAQIQADAGSLPYTTMGRTQGLQGAALAGDVASGRWRSQRYEVRAEGIPNKNWFTIAEFLALVAEAPAAE